MALMNATVSHEMRNPLNSILNQCAQFKFMLGELKQYIQKVKTVYQRAKRFRDPNAIFAMLDSLKLVQTLDEFHDKA